MPEITSVGRIFIARIVDIDGISVYEVTSVNAS